MKKILLNSLILLLGISLKAQNSFPTTGNMLLDGGYINLRIPNTTSSWARGFLNSDSEGKWLGGVGLLGTGTTPSYYYIAHGTSPWSSGLGIYVKPDGKVGVGTVAPKAVFNVVGSGTIASNDLSQACFLAGTTSIGIGIDDNEIRSKGSDLHIGTLDLRNLRLGTNARTSDLIIDSYGKVGVGKSSPISKLDINGGININGLNSIPSVNGFRNMLQFSGQTCAAIVYNPGQSNELMFGFHSNGNFYWGTGRSASTPDYYSMYLNGSTGNLGLKGKLTSNEVEVKIGGWADFVFLPTYNLKTLEQVETFIKANGHLPDVPSEKEVKENGLNLGESDAVLLQKIEELTLYVIEQNKKNKEQEAKIKALEAENQTLKEMQSAIEELQKQMGELKK